MARTNRYNFQETLQNWRHAHALNKDFIDDTPAFLKATHLDTCLTPQNWQDLYRGEKVPDAKLGHHILAAMMEDKEYISSSYYLRDKRAFIFAANGAAHAREMAERDHVPLLHVSDSSLRALRLTFAQEFCNAILADSAAHGIARITPSTESTHITHMLTQSLNQSKEAQPGMEAVPDTTEAEVISKFSHIYHYSPGTVRQYVETALVETTEAIDRWMEEVLKPQAHSHAGQLLKFFRHCEGKGHKDLQTATGIDYGVIGRKERAELPLHPSELPIFSKALGLNDDEFKLLCEATSPALSAEWLSKQPVEMQGSLYLRALMAMAAATVPDFSKLGGLNPSRVRYARANNAYPVEVLDKSIQAFHTCNKGLAQGEKWFTPKDEYRVYSLCADPEKRAGATLQALLDYFGVIHSQLATASHVSQDSIDAYCSGERPPTVKVIDAALSMITAMNKTLPLGRQWTKEESATRDQALRQACKTSLHARKTGYTPITLTAHMEDTLDKLPHDKKGGRYLQEILSYFGLNHTEAGLALNVTAHTVSDYCVGNLPIPDRIFKSTLDECKKRNADLPLYYQLSPEQFTTLETQWRNACAVSALAYNTDHTPDTLNTVIADTLEGVSYDKKGGKCFQEMMGYLGLNLREVSTILNTDRSTVSKYYTGVRIILDDVRDIILDGFRQRNTALPEGYKLEAPELAALEAQFREACAVSVIARRTHYTAATFATEINTATQSLEDKKKSGKYLEEMLGYFGSNKELMAKTLDMNEKSVSEYCLGKRPISDKAIPVILEDFKKRNDTFPTPYQLSPEQFTDMERCFREACTLSTIAFRVPCTPAMLADRLEAIADSNPPKKKSGQVLIALLEYYGLPSEGFARTLQVPDSSIQRNFAGRHPIDASRADAIVNVLQNANEAMPKPYRLSSTEFAVVAEKFRTVCALSLASIRAQQKGKGEEIIDPVTVAQTKYPPGPPGQHLATIKAINGTLKDKSRIS